MKLSISLFLIVSLFCLTFGQNCDNPVIKNPNEWGTNNIMNLGTLKLASTPIPAPSQPASCRHFSKEAGATLTCCTNETIKQITNAFALAENAVKVAENAIAQNNFTSDVVALIQSTVNFICKFAPCPPSVENTINKYVALLAEAAKGVVAAQTHCALGMLAYAEGMACFACETNWQKFLDNKTKVINLAEQTCTDVYRACSPIFSASMNVAITAQNFANEIVKDVANIKIPSMGTIPDMCGGTLAHPGDCSHFLCHTMLNGFGVPDMKWDPKVSPTAFLQQGQRRLAEGGASERQRLQGLLRDTVLAAQLQVLGPALAPRALAAVAAASSHNSYSAAGYDAYGVGCKDVSCESTGGSPSSPFPAWAVVLVVVAAVGVVVAGVFLVRRHSQAMVRSNSGYTSV